MRTIAFIFYYLTPYIALFVFVAGIVYQLARWRQQSPVPANLSLFPRPRGRLARVADTLLDMFTLKGLFKVNKPLWIGGFVMHFGLLLLVLGHVRAFTDYYFLWDLLRWGEEQQHQFSVVAGSIAGFLFMFPLFYLLARRFSGPLKWLSNPEDYLVLGLLIMIAVTGNHMRFVVDPDTHEVRHFLQGLFRLNWQTAPVSAGISFVYHFAFVQILMVYFPFSKLMHTIGGLFSKMVARG